MPPMDSVGSGDILIGIFALIVLFGLPLLATVFTVRSIAKQRQRSLGWGWAGFWSSIFVMILGVVLMNVMGGTIDVTSFGQFLLALIVWILVMWPLSTALAMVPFYLTLNRSRI